MVSYHTITICKGTEKMNDEFWNIFNVGCHYDQFQEIGSICIDKCFRYPKKLVYDIYNPEMANYVVPVDVKVPYHIKWELCADKAFICDYLTNETINIYRFVPVWNLVYDCLTPIERQTVIEQFFKRVKWHHDYLNYMKLDDECKKQLFVLILERWE